MKKYLATRAAAENKTKDDKTGALATSCQGETISDPPASAVKHVSARGVAQAAVSAVPPSIILFRSDEVWAPSARKRSLPAAMEAPPPTAKYRSARTRSRISSSAANPEMHNISPRISVAPVQKYISSDYKCFENIWIIVDNRSGATPSNNAPGAAIDITHPPGPGSSGSYAKGAPSTSAGLSGGYATNGDAYAPASSSLGEIENCNTVAVNTTQLASSGFIPANPIAIDESASQPQRQAIDGISNLEGTQNMLYNVCKINATVTSLKEQIETLNSIGSNIKKFAYDAEVRSEFSKRQQGCDETIFEYVSAKRGLAALLNLSLEEFMEPLLLGLRDTRISCAVAGAEVFSPNDLIDKILEINKRLERLPTARVCANYNTLTDYTTDD